MRALRISWPLVASLCLPLFSAAHSSKPKSPLNRLPEAEESAQEALRWKSDFPEACLLLADIHRRQKNYPTLLRDLDEYIGKRQIGSDDYFGWGDNPTDVIVGLLRRYLDRGRAPTAISCPNPCQGTFNSVRRYCFSWHERQVDQNRS